MTTKDRLFEEALEELVIEDQFEGLEFERPRPPPLVGRGRGREGRYDGPQRGLGRGREGGRRAGGGLGALQAEGLFTITQYLPVIIIVIIIGYIFAMITSQNKSDKTKDM